MKESLSPPIHLHERKQKNDDDTTRGYHERPPQNTDIHQKKRRSQVTINYIEKRQPSGTSDRTAEPHAICCAPHTAARDSRPSHLAAKSRQSNQGDARPHCTHSRRLRSAVFRRSLSYVSHSRTIPSRMIPMISVSPHQMIVHELVVS